MPREQTIPAKGEVLQWARHAAGLSVRAAARRLEITPMELVAIEDGETAASGPVFNRMIHVYRQVESILLLPYPPKRDPLPQDFRTAANATLSLSPETVLAIREARRIQHLVTDLRDLDRELIPYFQLGLASLQDETEDVASQERRRFGVTVHMQREWPLYDAFKEWRERTQSMGILVFLKKMPWKDCRGLSLWDERLVPAIVVNSEDKRNARTFTLFHEYAHLMLRQSGVCVQQDRGASNKERIERWCNSFAAEFLVPTQELSRAVSDRFPRLGPTDWTIQAIQRLANEFRVSRYVIARRLKEIGISDFYDVHGEQLRLHDKSPARETGGMQRPAGWQVQHKLAEIGRGTASVIIEGVRSHIADAGDVADLLGLRMEQLRELDEKSAASRA